MYIYYLEFRNASYLCSHIIFMIQKKTTTTVQCSSIALSHYHDSTK